MPEFRAFAALRYAPGIDLDTVLSPPYDVLSEEDADALRARDPHNITWIDLPASYEGARATLNQWIEEGILISDDTDSLSIYRLSFTDAQGTPREISGVFGGLAVVDEAGGVLPHERTTPKAKTDRLELTQATATNLSPVWGLSLAQGLTQALREPGEPMGRVEIDGVTHTVERVTDAARIEEIRAIIASDDVLIADGHHRYAISRTYRDQVREASGRTDTRAEYTLTFVNELQEEQLCIEAIHRVYSRVTADMLRAGLARYFTLSDAGSVDAGSVSTHTLTEMVDTGRMVVVWADGHAEWLTPKPGAFDHVRGLDGLWLETALDGIDLDVTYQHGLPEVLACVTDPDVTAVILIRPTSIDEIRRTAREGLLMPPKSTFFTPKLLTGWVLRPTEAL